MCFKYAQAYKIKQGWVTIPCQYKDKKPLIAWKEYQTRQPTTGELASWFPANQKRNLAIVTGDISNRLLVLDFDDYALFAEWWKEDFRRCTLTATTDKGVHLYFRLKPGEPALTNGKFSVMGYQCGDVRYNGGYVIAPPSVHPNGSAYRWIAAPLLEVTLTELPVTIPQMDQIDTSPTPTTRPERFIPHGPTPPPGSHGEVKRPRRYAEKALRNEADTVSQTPKGNRNNQLFQSAVKLAKYVNMLGDRLIQHDLLQAALSAGLDRASAQKTILSGLTKAYERSAK